MSWAAMRCDGETGAEELWAEEFGAREWWGMLFGRVRLGGFACCLPADSCRASEVLSR